MKIQTRSGLKAARNAVVAAAATAGLVLGSTGVASADVDDQNRIVSAGNEVIVTQSNTFIQGVPPIGGSPLSREWFHNGLGTANIVGPDAADFEDSTFQFGYQFAWSASIDGSFGVSWSTPDVGLDASTSPSARYEEVVVDSLDADGNRIPVMDEETGDQAVDEDDNLIWQQETLYRPIEGGGNLELDGLDVGVSSILPQATAAVELTPAPGIEELVVAEGDFDGDFKEVQFANVHGAATGVIGAVQVRPFVRVITSNGDNVTTYGKVWTL
ncbi:MAG: MspA family porin [Rhodococcus sp.]|nr:MspA family porin [Rhodococcus sp. (in: high G+C Gram-positive bacteria)]